MPYPSTESFLNVINNYVRRNKSTEVSEFKGLEEFGKPLNPGAPSFRVWAYTSLTGPTDDKFEKFKRVNYLNSTAADDEAVQMEEDLTSDFFKEKFEKIKAVLKAQKESENLVAVGEVKNLEVKVVAEDKSQNNVNNLAEVLASELELFSLKKKADGEQQKKLRIDTIKKYLLKRAEWEVNFPTKYPGVFVHPESRFAETLETDSSTVQQLIKERLTQDIENAAKKHVGEPREQLIESIYKAVPNLHHTNANEVMEIKQAIADYLEEKSNPKKVQPASLDRAKSKELKSDMVLSHSDIKDRSPVTRVSSFANSPSTRNLQELAPKFRFPPDFKYDASRIIPPSNFGNTIGWRAANPLYWPDAIIGTVCSLFNKAVCGVLNPILNTCDKLINWGKEQNPENENGLSKAGSYLKKGVGYFLGGLGRLLVTPIKYALIVAPVVVETITFAVATMGSGNFKDLGDLTELPKAFVGIKEKKAVMIAKQESKAGFDRQKSLSQSQPGLDRRSSSKHSLHPSPAARSNPSRNSLRISPVAHMGSSPSAKASSDASQSPKSPAVPGSIPESPKNLPSESASFRQPTTHSVVQTRLQKPGRLGSLTIALSDPNPTQHSPNPAGSPKHKPKFVNLSTVIENPNAVPDNSDEGKQLNTSSNEGDTKVSNDVKDPVTNRRNSNT